MECSSGGIPCKRAGLALGADLQENSEDVSISEGARSLLSVWDNHGIQPRAGGGETFIPTCQGVPCGCSLVRTRWAGARRHVSLCDQWQPRVCKPCAFDGLLVEAGYAARHGRVWYRRTPPYRAAMSRRSCCGWKHSGRLLFCHGVQRACHRAGPQGNVPGEIHQILPDRIPLNSGARLCVACNVFVF